MNGNKNNVNNGRKKIIRRFELKVNLTPRKILLWVLVLLLGLSLLAPLARPPAEGEEIDLSQALNDIKSNKIREIHVEGDRISLTYLDGQHLLTRKESGESFVKTLEMAGIDPKTVKIKIADQTLSRVWLDILGTFLPLVLMGVFFYFIIKQARGAQESIFSFGQSKPDYLPKENSGLPSRTSLVLMKPKKN
jgi:cell division protease FtsH